MDVEPPECPDDATWVIAENLWEQVVGVDLGSRYNALVMAWIALERGYSWGTVSLFIPASGRPKQVGSWIRSRRKAGKATKIPNVSLYAKEWWSWWGKSQPSWRKVKDGRPARTKADGRSWEGLVVPGLNGMISVVASLYWWGCVLAEKNQGMSQDWKDAVEDVIWVVNGLVESGEQPQ
ncbi:hypothetical protein C8F01DRAFT_1001054 [Mycena amicta]|nr:hypothetical protein C8F01DRAFT_1001054 [Mycena amicta]